MHLYLISENANRIGAMKKMLQFDEKLKMPIVDALISIDPTISKRFCLWLAILTNRRIISISGIVGQKDTTQIRLPEDGNRVSKVLEIFERKNKSLPADKRDILKHQDFYSVEETVDALIQSGKAVATASVRKVPGAEIVYDKSPYVIYKVAKVSKMPKDAEHGSQDHLTPDEMQRVKAIEILGMGPPETKWCTRTAYGENTMASVYLSKRDMYVIYKDGKPFLQKCGGAKMDVNDRKFDIPLELIPTVEPPRLEGNLKLPEDFVCGKATITTMENNVIEADKIIDAGDLYLYICIGKGNQRRLAHSISNKVRKHMRLGLKRVIKNPGYTGHKIVKYEPTAADMETTGYGRQSASEDYWNRYRKAIDATQKYILIKLYNHLLTINKENIRSIKTQSGEHYGTQLQQNLPQESFISRLNGVLI